MKKVNDYNIVMARATKGVKLPEREKRKVTQVAPAGQVIEAKKVLGALKKTGGADAILKEHPDFNKIQLWAPVATFSPCQKTGTATYLDVWDADHFDGFTDIKHNLNECRIWFSAEGYSFWDAPQTKTGRINCYFRAPSDGNYVCNVQLQSYGGNAVVECLIDSFNYGPLGFNGSITQPHPAFLNAGYHSFRIRQKSGSFFFNSLTVWKV